jgi:hypothetical protein
MLVTLGQNVAVSEYSTNKTLRCLKLVCCTGINMFIIIIIIISILLSCLQIELCMLVVPEP